MMQQSFLIIVYKKNGSHKVINEVFNSFYTAKRYAYNYVKDDDDCGIKIIKLLNDLSVEKWYEKCLI